MIKGLSQNQVYMIMALQRIGFRCTDYPGNWQDEQGEDIDCLIMTKLVEPCPGQSWTERPRYIEAQFFPDGMSRMSHMLGRKLPNGITGWRGTTHPTQFDSIETMHLALARETSRQDHKADPHHPNTPIKNFVFIQHGDGRGAELLTCTHEQLRKVFIESLWSGGLNDLPEEIESEAAIVGNPDDEEWEGIPRQVSFSYEDGHIQIVEVDLFLRGRT